MRLKKNKLWQKAIKIIPQGTQLFSKRPERFLPDYFPTYYKKAKGCYIWDLDGNKYIDMSYMGIGTCILGYADPDVNRAVKKAIDEGSMSTLNCPEDVELAELLLELHPWAGMVRYARTGGEAMAIAVRIARAYTGKEKIVFCGYHGWHDWYGAGAPLKVAGIPKCLKRLSKSFHYNKFEEIPQTKDIAAIVMEVVREREPKKGFLKKIRKLATKLGAVLIFDEITSGFRCNIGGIHLLYGVNPDMAVFAKGMSNGYPMAAIIGKKRVMKAVEKTYISSTYWTERIGPVAALATIKKMKKLDVPDYLVKIGEIIKVVWQLLVVNYGLDTEELNISPLITFKFNYPNSQAIWTLFTQEMLKRGIIAGKAVYISWAHRAKHISRYLDAIDEVLGIISKAIENKKVEKLLKGSIAHEGFERLT